MYGSRIDEAVSSTWASRSEDSITVPGNDMSDPESHWYAVWIRSRQEKVASTMLNNIGVQQYLPLKSELRQWSDRKQMVETPVFSCYLFVRINLMKDSRLQVLKSPGVIGIVGNKTGPIPIPDQEIQDIRRVLAARIAYSLYPALNKGDRVRVVRGVLTGVEGTLVRANPTSHLLVSIDLIRQSLAVCVSAEEVERIGTNPVLKENWTNSQVLSIRS
jgi:transcriptional antiterminator RfaH